MSLQGQQPDVTFDFIAAGGNRHPSAADWAPSLVAFGAGNNIALWNPEDEFHVGISALLAGHNDQVNAVKFLDWEGERLIISGGSDKTVRLWKPTRATFPPYEEVCCLAEHSGSVNSIAVLSDDGFFVTGAADGTLKVWKLQDLSMQVVQAISLKPHYLPLSSALTRLADGSIVLAVGGTSTVIQLFVRLVDALEFVIQATLTGHEGWIRSLDFVHDGEDILLASASQDKYIRLWRFRRLLTAEPDAKIGIAGGTAISAEKPLSNKAHLVGNADCQYTVTFEALLIGHEDWVYTAKWRPPTEKDVLPTLLSASADNSLAVWIADEASGVWVCNARLGEISAQKGSTTATGSTGGFWIGMWQPNGQSVVSLGRTGSWRRWIHSLEKDMWEQAVGVSGHTKEVQSLVWAPDGSYLLTTGSDQSTRMFAEWRRDSKRSWHEFARPQIHGYDLNCIDSIGQNQFVSGAEEKLLRVFNKPKAIDALVARLSGTKPTVNGELADAANVPVLGLSNKAVAAMDDDEHVDGIMVRAVGEHEAADPSSIVRKSTLALEHPPLEDHLARHTLWPEHEKLYGHGYEIAAVAASHDGSLVATACKASSIDHAVIRLYETKAWRELKPPLTAHSLTVTSLAFSGDDKYLLSVGRDRQWVVFSRKSAAQCNYQLLTSNPKGHARMILDCDWAPLDTDYFFATAGRDKAVKIWKLRSNTADCVKSMAATAAVTAVAFSKRRSEELTLAYGTDDGDITIAFLHVSDPELAQPNHLAKLICPSKSVSRLIWRPDAAALGRKKQLAAASDDGSVRILNVAS
ncbi:hypothetical protein BAUCODRAFT_426117 [Baudoinia panamericana UAMH 10762]|uniref:Elongator complex protein 2 n=1 Tax=Baudoinia panamericana (strain UAMH 10762) TaxID=717646 RepID=M2NGK3_BAUPA|nr:uncharacterized protein BAUCODRAFT_426117 [Baudoinia panamericana UAMH 10762]EMC98439.1 hypothetical protein BAUCODRAFT_426117 [Baudoinia panamericana UAMH 10762]